MKLRPAVSYQGSKTRLASKIVNAIDPFKYHFFDMCCGNGSISLYLVEHGEKRPEQITMIDAGPWGLVWQRIGDGKFDLNEFEWWLNKIPEDKSKIKSFMEDLSNQSAGTAIEYVYLILQAGSFGGKAIWIKGDKWQNTSFRNYWEPTETSSRRYPVNPMMPMPDTLFKRMVVICENMLGVTGRYDNIENYFPRDATIYIDPPYEGRTEYGHDIDDLMWLASTWQNYGNDVFISEGKPLTIDARMISGSRDKGGISGERKSKNEEWLSFLQSEYLFCEEPYPIKPNNILREK